MLKKKFFYKGLKIIIKIRGGVIIQEGLQIKNGKFN